MQVTIVGLPGSGKTTVFNALTGVQAETGFSGGRAAPNLAVVKVPDDRLDRLGELFHPRKVTPADVTYADVAIPAGAAGEGTVAPDLLAQVRNADALVHVLRSFEDPGVERPADPWRDLEELDLEYAVADLAVVQKRLEKLRTSGRHGSPAEREANAQEEALLERIEPDLAEGHPLRAVALEDEEEKRERERLQAAGLTALFSKRIRGASRRSRSSARTRVTSATKRCFPRVPSISTVRSSCAT